MKYKRIGLVFIFASMLIAGHSFAEDAPPSFQDLHADKSYIFLVVQDEVKVNADWSYTSRVQRKVLIQKKEWIDSGMIAAKKNNNDCLNMFLYPDSVNKKWVYRNKGKQIDWTPFWNNFEAF